ncbi:thioredoxin-dependent thiol peroxidase [Myxococcota bacterium]|nr:thioredoxin-dependent thiol peroxidase [Myxococcota bacterium]
MPAEIGQPAPDFTAAASTGEQVSLSSLRGKPVVLYFYPKNDTPGCTKEACAFRDLGAEFAAAGAAIYGVSGDSLKSHDKFIQKYGLTFPLLSDADHTLHEAYGTWGEKKLYGKVSMGTVRSTFLIDAEGVIRGVWRKVKVDGHVEAVLAAVKVL